MVTSGCLKLAEVLQLTSGTDISAPSTKDNPTPRSLIWSSPSFLVSSLVTTPSHSAPNYTRPPSTPLLLFSSVCLSIMIRFLRNGSKVLAPTSCCMPPRRPCRVGHCRYGHYSQIHSSILTPGTAYSRRDRKHLHATPHLVSRWRTRTLHRSRLGSSPGDHVQEIRGDVRSAYRHPSHHR